MAKKEKKQKKVKEPKAKKPRKRKEKSEGGGIKLFFANHIEKLLFGLAGLLCLLLVVSGFRNRDGIDADKTPSSLDQKIKTTARKVDNYTWERDYADILKKDDKDFPQRADQALKPLESDAYTQKQLLRPPISPPRTKRTDPDLFAVQSLQVRDGHGILRKEVMRGAEGRGGPQDQVAVPDFGDQPPEDEEIGPDMRPIPNQPGRSEGRRGRGGDGEGVYFVSVTGLVPVRKQLEEYQNRLLNSRGHDPGRDTPTYVNWWLERASVTADGQTGKYRRIVLFAKLEDQNQRTRGGRDSVVRMGESGADNFDPKFSDPVLTHPVPNIEVRNGEALFIHDRIAELTLEEKQKALRQPDTGQSPDVEDETDVFGRTDATTGPDGRPGGFQREIEQYRDGGRQEGGGRFEGGQRRIQRGLDGDTPLEDAPEFYMFRYVDTKVTPGQRYKYRLKLVIEDPNAPNSGNDPLPETLEASVANRLAGVKKYSTPFFGRICEYGPESPVVRVRRGQTILAGDVQPAGNVVVRSTGQVFRKPGAEPVAQVMALMFDFDRALEIPGEVEVRPGSVVDFRKEVEVPLQSLGFLKKEKHHFQLESVVLDIRGGEEAKFDLLSRPGELLVWDESGQISVLNELVDAELYQQNTFEPEQRSSREEGRLEGGEGRRREGAREGGRGEGDGERRSRRRPG